MYSNKMCRTCLCSGTEMRSLFGEKLQTLEKGSPSAADILRIFTCISFDTNEDLPDHICIACFNEVHRTYLFKLKCEKSESILLKLKESKVDAIKVEALEDVLNDTKIEGSGKIQTEVTQPCVNGKYVQDFKNEPELDVDVNDDDIGNELKEVEQLPSHSPIVNNEELEQDLRKQSKDMQIESIEEHTSNQSEYEEDYTELDVDESIISCSICPNERFEEKAQLERHNLKVHTDIYGIKCSICSARFSKHIEFMVHMSEIHNCEKPYECELCGSHFPTKPALKHHLRSKHPQEISAVNVFKCEICSKILPYKARYIEHLRSHTSTKPFQCTFCSERFRNRLSMKSHMRTKHVQEYNDGKPDFQCSVCSKIFGTKDSLDRHMFVHIREEAFQCKVCSAKFRHSESLTCHMRRKHANESNDGKPEFQCNICSKIFGFNNRLVRHMNIHTGEKPYDCKQCSEKFRYSYALKSHMERKHPNEAVSTAQ